MTYQPPAGARDLLPLDVIQKSWIKERLQQVFHRWGYHRIITSTLESLDTLVAGGAVQPSTVVKLEAEEGTLGLRPELTASIARATATRMTGYPQRLYYNANVFQHSQSGNHGTQQEFYQAGVELLGAGGLMADAEVLLLLANSLNQLGLSDWQIILGDAGLRRSFLSPFPGLLQEQVRKAIANLDRVTLLNLPLSKELRDRALFLFDLRGNPTDVLQQVSALDLDAAGRDSVNNLKSLVELLSDTPFPLILDLSLIQTFDYYTGIVFKAVVDNRVIGQGGRYDQLLGLYHPQQQTSPGIGFSLQIEALHQALLQTSQLPRRIPRSNWLVVPKTKNAIASTFSHAQKLRDSQHLVRVEVHLGDNNPDAIREYARRRHISYIAWVTEDGIPIVESLM